MVRTAATLVYPFLSARRSGGETPELQESYRAAYLEHLRNRYRGEPRAAFDEVLRWPRVVLLCFCKPHEFCHRILLAEALQAVGSRRGLEVNLRGELERGQVPEGEAFWRAPARERLAAAAAQMPPNEQLIIGEGNKCRPFEVRSASGERIGGGFICGGRRSSPTCRGLAGCSRKSKFLCDFPLDGAKAGKTCDRPLCGACAVVVGSDLHYCPTHHGIDPERRAALR